MQRLRSLKDAKARREAGLFLVEGEVMIREALSCGLKLRELAAEEAHADFAREVCGNARGFIVTRSLLETICDTRTPQGVCAAFEQPEPVALEQLPERLSLIHI